MMTVGNGHVARLLLLTEETTPPCSLFGCSFETHRVGNVVVGFICG